MPCCPANGTAERRCQMKFTKFTIMFFAGMLLFSSRGYSDGDNTQRLQNSVDVFKQIMKTPDKAIPKELLDGAQCIVIVPAMKKGAFIFGAEYGKGYLSCRKEDGVGWTAPGTIRIEGGSFGFQFGGEEADVVLLVMNKSGENKLLSSQFTLGAGASVAAGPVGRATKAETDALMTAEILSWSRTHGVFAGISLQGATLRQDVGDNRDLYGRTLENREIIDKQLPVPPAAKPLIALLDKYSPRKEKG
jgi:lipid-binding SYLF domain-containing protein